MIYGLPEQTLRAGQGRLKVQVEIPAPYKLNPGSPLEYQVNMENILQEPRKRVTVKDGQFPLQIPLTLVPGQTEIRVAVSFVYCREGDAGVCIIKSLRWIIPANVTHDGDTELQLPYKLVPEVPGLMDTL